MKRTSSGRRNVPIKALVYGPPGVGKTSMVAGAPDAVILDLEAGSSHLDVNRIEVDTYDEIVQVIREHRSGTLAVDSLSKVQEMVTDKVLGPVEKRSDGLTLVNWGVGYGAGWQLVQQYWREMIAAMMRCPANVVLIAHSIVKTHNDPSGVSFDRYIPDLNEKNLLNPTLKEMDYVMFAHMAHETRKVGGRVIGVTGDRVLETGTNAAWTTKHRGSLPDTLPLDWTAFQDAVEADRGDSTKTIGELESMIVVVEDVPLREKMFAALTAAGTDTNKLGALMRRVEAKLNEKKES